MKHSLLTAMMFGLCFGAATTQADIGDITINDKAVPAVLFKGFAQHQMTPDNVCPPVSDTYVRDRIIRRALVVFEGEERGLSIEENSRNNIEKFGKELEYLGPDGNDKAIAKAEILRHFYTYSGYLDHFPAVVKHEDILSEYKRLIKAKDPRFTDVVVVRRTPLEFTSEGDANKAIELLNAGTSVDEVTKLFEEDYFHFHITPQWTPIYDVDKYEGDGTELESGMAISAGGAYILYFDEVKFRSRLRPFTEYRNSDSYVYKEVKWDVLKVRQFERDKALWEAADVRENGKPISLSDSYPACS